MKLQIVEQIYFFLQRVTEEVNTKKVMGSLAIVTPPPKKVKDSKPP